VLLLQATDPKQSEAEEGRVRTETPSKAESYLGTEKTGFYE